MLPKINNGAVFASASSKNFSRASASALVPASSLTVSAWVYLASNNGEAIVSKGNIGVLLRPLRVRDKRDQRALVLLVQRIERGLGGWSIGHRASILWYHVAVTFNAGSVAFYVNGVQQGTTQSAVVSSLNQSDTNSFFAGAYSTNGGTTANAAFFDGKMDEVGIWSRARSATEVSQLYNGGAGRSYQFTPEVTEGSGQNEAVANATLRPRFFVVGGRDEASAGRRPQSMSFELIYESQQAPVTRLWRHSGRRTARHTTVYAYPQTGYMNPDAVGSIGNGFSTTTYTYDNNGNLMQAGGWSYVWDYLNRMLASRLQ